MGARKIVLIVLLNLCVTFHAYCDQNQNGYAADLGMMSAGVEKIASATATARADVDAAQDMRNFQATINCIYSSNYPHVSYKQSHKLPEPGQPFAGLRDSYINLLQRVNALRDELDMPPVPDFENIIDADGRLYKVAAASPEYQMTSAVRRVESDSSSNDISAGIAMIASAASLGGIKDNTAAAQNTDIRPMTENPAANNGDAVSVPQKNNPENVAISAAAVEQDSKQDNAPEQDADSTDEADELCEEFPDEPECME